MVVACEEAGIELSGKSVLLLGSGGTASAIAVAFGETGVGDLHIANRDVEHAARLRDKLRLTGVERISVSSLAALEHDAPDADVIVNATPLGMKEGDPLPLPPEYVQRGRAICDVVYRPGKETPLVRLAKERGARHVAGGRMLLYQGVLAQKLWTGRDPNVQAMDRAIS
jgi:shikimate dehydrogenase